jgi:hypothetical protein
MKRATLNPGIHTQADMDHVLHRCVLFGEAVRAVRATMSDPHWPHQCVSAIHTLRAQRKEWQRRLDVIVWC